MCAVLFAYGRVDDPESLDDDEFFKRFRYAEYIREQEYKKSMQAWSIQ